MPYIDFIQAEIERMRVQIGRQRKEILQLQRAGIGTAGEITHIPSGCLLQAFALILSLPKWQIQKMAAPINNEEPIMGRATISLVSVQKPTANTPVLQRRKSVRIKGADLLVVTPSPSTLGRLTH